MRRNVSQTNNNLILFNSKSEAVDKVLERLQHTCHHHFKSGDESINDKLEGLQLKIYELMSETEQLKKRSVVGGPAGRIGKIGSIGPIVPKTLAAIEDTGSKHQDSKQR